MSIEIRRAGFSDISDMSEVVDSAWRKNYRDIFSDEVIERYTGKHRRDSFIGLITNGTDIRVLSVDGRITALCAFRALENEHGCAEIMLMYVHSDRQRQGLGGRLLSHILSELREAGYTRAVLDTAEKNEGARRFYEKQGFTPQKQYTNGISYVTYGKKL